MRVLTVIALLSGLALFCSDAVSNEVVAGGTITRLDAETCRVAVGFTWSEVRIFPAATCNHDYQSYPGLGAFTSLSGPFGTPEQMIPEPVSYGDGGASWVGHNLGAEFNFKPSSTQTDIAIFYYVREEEEIEIYSCDQPDPCPQLCSSSFGYFAGRTLVVIGEASGTVYAELPQGIGEFTTLREIPVAVTERTWSQVKAMFRE